MKKLLGLLACLTMLSIGCSGCAGRNIEPQVEMVIPNQGVALFTSYGFGRGCPVVGVIATASHVLSTSYYNKTYGDAWWSDQFGGNGFARRVGVDTAVDGAILEAVGPSPTSIPIGDVTETLYFYDYDYSTKEDAFSLTLQRATLVREIGGHIIFDVSPAHGSSGGCLFNDVGDAVGIVVWIIGTDDAEHVGVGLRFPEDWR